VGAVAQRERKRINEWSNQWKRRQEATHTRIGSEDSK